MLDPDRKAALATVLLALFAASANSAMADTKSEKHHPRRDEVNDRLARQNKRITEERKEGDLSKHQANALRKEDHRLRQEEQGMASHHGGHITQAEQRTLNRQEDAVSRQISK
jgi:hypothetical protein